MVLKPLRYGAAAFATLGLAFLPGCASHAPAAAPAPVSAPKPAGPIFTLNTPIEIIAADPRGKAVLLRDLPGLMASRSYPLFDDMSLADIATVSGGRLTKAKLDLVQTDLSQIPAPAQ
jgi:hypothetical protein